MERMKKKYLVLFFFYIAKPPKVTIEYFDITNGFKRIECKDFKDTVKKVEDSVILKDSIVYI